MNNIVQVATLAGQIIIENGGEIYRVEETICRVSKAFGAHEAESFVTPTGLMCSIEYEGKTYSIVKRVAKRTVDLDKIDRVNDLSRRINVDNMSVCDFKRELDSIRKGQRYSVLTTLIFSALGAGSFTILFGGTFKDLIAAFIIGLVIKYFSIVASDFDINIFFINSIAGALAASLALVFTKIGIASNINETIIGSIMLLVPGLAITNAIRDTIAGDLVSGMTRAAEAFFIAVSIAVGTGAVLSFWISNFGGL